jgi:ABC-type sugar transport system ATPase subunit
MKVLSGVHDEWEGQIMIDDRNCRFSGPKEAENEGISIIYQELNLVPHLSVAENIFLGREPVKKSGFVDFQRMNNEAEKILTDLHFPHSVKTPVANLRVGHQQLVEIAKALSVSARILILDEPTSALSESETKTLYSVIHQLKLQCVTIVYISHRMSEIFDLADRITVLRDGKNVDVLDAKSITRKRLIQLMVGRSFEQFFVKESTPKDEIILQVENITRRDEKRKMQNRLENITFKLKKGEILGIAGLLGAGRTELLESLFGASANETSGVIKLEDKEIDVDDPQSAISAGISLITEDRKGNGLVVGMDILHNLSLAALNKIVNYGSVISNQKEEELASQYIGELSIDVNRIDLPVESLSGGNQQKVLLAKWLATDPKVLLLDDPTRGIDVATKYDIYVLLSKLANSGISIIMSSSELPELLTICDRILVLREGRLSAIVDHEDATQEIIMEAATPVI